MSDDQHHRIQDLPAIIIRMTTEERERIKAAALAARAESMQQFCRTYLLAAADKLTVRRDA